MRTAALTCTLLFALADPLSAQPLHWSRYSNPQLGVGVDMPTDLFAVDGGPARSFPGQTFRTADGRADLSIYAIDNQARDTPAAFLRNRFQQSGPAAVYRRVTPRILAVSGFRGDQIWYARCNFSNARVNCVALNYPAREKRAWDAVVTRISNTLSSPGG
jgi:hypothetical protein